MSDGPTTRLPEFNRDELGQLRDAISGRRDLLDALLNQSQHPAMRAYIDKQLAVLFRLAAAVALAQADLEGDL